MWVLFGYFSLTGHLYLIGVPSVEGKKQTL